MSKQANKRLQKEYASLAKAPPPFVLARPYESNLLECHFILRGPADSPYAGGEYHGVLQFTQNYPFAPPGIKMYTPSGRFQPDRKLCTSFSDFHAGSWNPSWSVSTILTGLLSFMLSDEMTTGSIRTTEQEKKTLAKTSHEYNLRNAKFKAIFPDHSGPELKDLPNMGQFDIGKPDGPPLPANLGNPDGSAVAAGSSGSTAATSATTGDSAADVAGLTAAMKGASTADPSSGLAPTGGRDAAQPQKQSSARRLLYGLSVLVIAALFLRVIGG